VSEVRWIPGSDNLFAAAMNDGTFLVFDKDLEERPLPLPKERTGEFAVVKPEARSNPTACWLVSGQTLKSFEFSPDCRHVAIVGKDGTLKVFDFSEERLLVTFKSYFGGLSCVCWSPDGKYLLTGGEDDLVSIWDFEGRTIVARCEGHQSWVSGLAFDPFKSDEKVYRFGSVGEDTKLLLWDFSVGALNRPRAVSDFFFFLLSFCH